MNCKCFTDCLLQYLISHLDRANLGNAKIEGLEKTLGMTGTDYNIAGQYANLMSFRRLANLSIVSVFFIPYILLEIPSNIILARFKKPSLYMGSECIS